MSSAGEDRSLASGIPIPQWMRHKTENYGFDPSTLSPPMHEGEFFYIKFPKPPPVEASNLKSLSSVLEGKEQAFVKHTESCKKFIPKIQETVQVQKPKVIKPMGVDDGFKGEAAACGASVVEVAHQMLSGKSFRPLNRGETEGSLNPTSSYLNRRRDSKSLPASPTATPESSPLTRRKNNQKIPARLFGGGFLVGENLNSSDENIDKKSSSWILTNLFSGKEKKENEKEGTSDKSVVVADTDASKAVRYKEGTSDNLKDPVNVTVEIQAISPAPPTIAKPSILKSKPHLRDLNILSPSSM